MTLKQTGFTIMELLLVVALMAVVAGSVIVTGSDTHQNAKKEAARYEMNQLREALLAYRNDVGFLPANADRASPADLSFLLKQPSSVANWDPDYRLGWRGPYLGAGDGGYVVISDSLGLNGLGDPTDDSGDPAQGNDCGSTVDDDVRAVPDPFTFEADGNWLYWRTTSCVSDTEIAKMGRPYLVFDLDTIDATDSIARIVSMGPNGIYELGTMTAPCVSTWNSAAGGDDLVLCLK